MNPDPVLANVERRKQLLDAARDNPQVQASIIDRCRADIFVFLDFFTWQINPRHVGLEVGPWITHPHQREAIIKTRQWLADGEDVLWEKARYQGATWMAILMEIHDALFFNYKKFLNISHTENAVDATDDPDSLFWKVQFVLDKLPPWMVKGAGRQRRGLIKFPATHSSMTGAATTERAGVGGRATWVLADEFAKQKDDFAILGQTADTGPRLFVSTHYGIGTAWYHLTQRPDIKKIVLHWSQHPEMNQGLYRSNADGTIEILDTKYEFPEDYAFVKSGKPTGGPYPGIRSPWYDKECLRRQNERDVAMHLDINPKASQSQYFPEMLIYRLRQESWLWKWEGDLAYDPDSAMPVGLIPRVGGPLRLWINPTPEGKVPKDAYVFGCDPSHGMGATPTCVSIGRARTGEKIGEWVSAHMMVPDFTRFFVALARLFTDGDSGAFLIWERMGPGELLTKRIIETGYRNFYYRQMEQGLVAETTDVPGWYPSPEATKILFDQYIAGLADGTCTNPSDRSLEQCLNFRYDARGYPEHPNEKSKSDPSAGGVNHGDIVRADALMWKVMKDKLVRQAAVKAEEIPVGSFQWRRELRTAAARLQEQF